MVQDLGSMDDTNITTCTDLLDTSSQSIGVSGLRLPLCLNTYMARYTQNEA